MTKKDLIISIILKSLAVILVIVGVTLNFLNMQEFMTGSKGIYYFTIQSNILVGIVGSIVIVIDVFKLKEKPINTPKVFNYFKLITTTAITLTMIVFWVFLMPQLPIRYSYSVANLTLHTFAPLFTLIDYILYTDEFKVSKVSLMSVWIFPTMYFVFAMIVSLFNIDFGNGMNVPYFFLDYKKNGWFKIGNGSMGVIYWVVIMFVMVYLMGFVINITQNLVLKQRRNKNL